MFGLVHLLNRSHIDFQNSHKSLYFPSHFLKEKQALDLKDAKKRDPEVERGCWKQTCLKILTLSGKLSVFVVPCKLDFDMKEH